MALKKPTIRRSNPADLSKQLEGQNKKFAKDTRFWEATTDKAGNGSATIRFLPGPACDGDDASDYVHYYEHWFQDDKTKLYYAERSLTTLGLPDPLSEYNTRLWNTDLQKNIALARKQKRKLTFVSNILVINDPGNPDNNGKVFLFKYGVKIMAKIALKMGYTINNKGQFVPDPTFDEDSDVRISVYDAFEGCNFKLKIKRVDKYTNYDDSEFGPQTPVSKDEEKIHEIWNQAHSLKAENAPSKYKSYDELKAQLEKVFGFSLEAKAKNAAASKPKADEDAPAPEAEEEEVTTASLASEADEDYREFEDLANS